MIQKIIYYLFVLIFICACQTNLVRQFNQVQVGMDKDEVLELMGPPDTTTRFKGKDRWFYVFYDKENRQEKEVHFLNGKATYVGGPWQAAPGKTAEAVDQSNEQASQEAEAKAAQRKEKIKKSNPLDEYEKEVKGEGTKVKYMPDFKPVQ